MWELYKKILFVKDVNSIKVKKDIHILYVI